MGCMQSTPVNGPVAAAAPASNKSVGDVTSAPASQSVAVPEPEIEVAPVSAHEKKFTVSGVSITDVGVVFYHVEAADASVSIKRRFNDFKALYAGLGPVSGLPALPEAGLRTALRGKHSQELISEREVRFAAILNAVANTPALAESAAFQKFVTEA